MKVKSILLSILLICGFAYAIGEKNIQNDTVQKIEEVTKTLNSKSLSLEDKSKRVFELFDGFFDFDRMSSLCLGKAQWSALSEQQQHQFSEKFIQKLKHSFVEKLSLYTDEKIIVKDVAKPSKNRIQLPIVLVDGAGKTYDILFKFYDVSPDEWLIYDVDVLGVSIVQNYRSQFDGVLQKSSFEELMQKIDSLQMDDNITK
ncbi:MAG: ABC transporter substrate-binding protein [Campylobacteraceae bacterium]|nr:ABC transporter substrate-binding protein [Campylobacteraceae bacterium]